MELYASGIYDPKGSLDFFRLRVHYKVTLYEIGYSRHFFYNTSKINYQIQVKF